MKDYTTSALVTMCPETGFSPKAPDAEKPGPKFMSPEGHGMPSDIFERVNY
jgi:hypothetical protein